MFKNSAKRLLAQACVMAFALISSVIINRTLGPENKGHYAIVNLTISLIITFGYLGFNQSLTFHKAKGTFLDSHLWTFAVLFGAVLGVVLAGIGLIIVNIVLVDVLGLDQKSQLFLSFGIVLIVSRLITSFLRSYLLGGKEFAKLNKTEILEPFASLVLLIIFLLILDDDVIAIYSTWLLTPILMMIVLLWVTKEHWSLHELPIMKLLKENARYGFKSYITNFVQFFNYQIDQFILNLFWGPTQVGIYSVAVGLGGYLWQLSNAVQLVVFPTVAALAEEEAKAAVARANRNTLFLTTVGGCALALCGYWLIKILYSDEFVGAYSALVWLLPGIIAFCAVKVLTAGLAAAGRPEFGSIITAFSTAITVVLDFVLIPNSGLIGAAQASAIGYSAGGLLSVVIYHRFTNVPISRLLLLQPEDIRAYSGMLMSIMKGWLPKVHSSTTL